MSKLPENYEVSVQPGYRNSLGGRVVYIDFGDVSFSADGTVRFICGAFFSGMRIRLASIQYRLDGFKGAYGSRFDLDKRAFLDLEEVEEQVRQGYFDEAAPRVAELIRSRLHPLV